MTDVESAGARPEPARGYRWLVLVSCAVAMFGNYYVFDALAPVTPDLSKTFGFTGEQVGYLDTAYNVAALLTLIAGGVLIDRLGTARAAVLFAAIGSVGTALIAVLPAVFPSWPLASMLVGRFVLGVGSESFIVAATTVVGRWFKGREISFALAIQLVVARLGSYTADLSPTFAKSLFTGWQPPLLAAAVVGVGWFAFSLVYAALEGYASRRYGVKGTVVTDKLVLSDLVRFSRAYWWVVGLCVAFYATIFPFRSLANLFFVEFREVSNEAAGSLKSVLNLFSMIGMPLFGLVADRFGKRALMMTVGSALLVPPFVLMLYWHTGILSPELRLPLIGTVVFASGTPLELIVAMGMMGLAFALVPAVLWPAVTYLVPAERLGSAYALMTFCQQAAWAVMTPAVGSVKDSPGAGWVPAIWMFAALSLAGFVFSFLLWREEKGPQAHGLESRKA